jgi:HTH-type transcriptional regulator, transcriptional repressor of NAD biosynthesis genes
VRPPAFEHALVVGKFYPPHLGHEYLIRTALRHCRRVTVAVLASSQELIPMHIRALWLRESLGDHPQLRIVAELDDVPIDYQDAVIWALHVDIMRQALERADREHEQAAIPVDAVFSSEAYGDELARHFSAAHVCLDGARTLYPVSATAIRADLAGHWHLLPSSVRAGLTARVVVLGAESTGTTTLTLDLRRALRARGGAWAATHLVPEYGREYSANLVALARARGSALPPSDLDWQEADFIDIAHEQTRRENLCARSGSPVTLCDTDALATCVWHERYRGQPSAAVARIAAALPPRALYILTDPSGVPFEDDGLRDGEAHRPWMTERFRQLLDAQRVFWLLVQGSRAERCAQALDAIDTVLKDPFRWTRA